MLRKREMEGMGGKQNGTGRGEYLKVLLLKKLPTGIGKKEKLRFDLIMKRRKGQKKETEVGDTHG